MDRFIKGYLNKYFENENINFTFDYKDTLNSKIKIYRNENFEFEIFWTFQIISTKRDSKKLFNELKNGFEIMNFKNQICDYKASKVYFDSINRQILNENFFNFECKGKIANSISFQNNKIYGAKYIIETIENMPSDLNFDKSYKIDKKIKTKYDFDGFIIKENKLALGQFINNYLHFNILGIDIYLVKYSNKQKPYSPGFIYYKGFIDKEKRDIIRECISYYLGRILILLEETTYNNHDEEISFNAYNPNNTMDGRALKILTCEAKNLKTQLSIDSIKINAMVCKMYKIYKKYNLQHVLWRYWHANCSALHTKCGEFGLTIEALANIYIENNELCFDNNDIEKNKFNKIKKESLYSIIDSLDYDNSIKQTIKENISSSVNKYGIKKTLELLFEHLEIHMEKKYLISWKSRNDAAHGKIIEDYSISKILKDAENLKEFFQTLLDGVISKG